MRLWPAVVASLLLAACAGLLPHAVSLYAERGATDVANSPIEWDETRFGARSTWYTGRPVPVEAVRRAEVSPGVAPGFEPDPKGRLEGEPPEGGDESKLTASIALAGLGLRARRQRNGDSR